MTAQLIVVSMWAAGKGRSSVHGCRESHEKNRAGMNTENAEAATPEASRSSDLSEELQSKAFCQLHWYPCISMDLSLRCRIFLTFHVCTQGTNPQRT